MSDRVRLSDVAAEAGVTKGIASRVLNGDPSVAVRGETRDRIHRIARELGYRPHAGARALATARTMTLALLVPALDNPPYVTIARGAYRRAAELGYLALLAEDLPDQPPAIFDRARVDGVIVGSAVPGHPLLARLAELGIPHVLVNRAVPGSGRNVTMDVGAASEVAVRFLRDLGHTRIAALAGPEDVEPSRQRLAAFEAVIAAAGLPRLASAHTGFGEGDVAAAIDTLLAEHPTAIFTSSLAQAIGVLRALHDRGIAVPGDVSVIAYDDFPIAAATIPALTTVAMPLEELGAAAVDELIAQLGGAPPRDLVIATDPRIVTRESTAPPR